MASLWNATGMGLGFTFGLLCIGGVREILGAGKFFGISLFGDHFQPWVVMVLPPGGFFIMATWLIVFAAWRSRKQRVAAAQASTEEVKA